MSKAKQQRFERVELQVEGIENFTQWLGEEEYLDDQGKPINPEAWPCFAQLVRQFLKAEFGPLADEPPTPFLARARR